MPNLTAIGTQCFSGVSKLKRITNLGSISTIGGQAFQSTNMEFVDIPETITLIDYQAFRYCFTLHTVVCRATTVPTLGSNVFQNTNNTFIIYVPAVSLTAYREATNWIAYASRIFPIEDYMDGGIFTFADSAVEALCVAN